MNDLTLMSSAPAIHDQPPRATRWLIGSIAATLVALVVWAHFAQIDQVTRTRVQLISEARTQVIQAPDGGVVTGIYVREGQTVKAGQLLITMDQDRAEAAVADSRAKVAALRITLARLEAEVYGRQLNFPDEFRSYADLMKAQRDLYSRRQAALHDDLSSMQNLLALSQQELAMNQELEASGDVSRAEILRLERSNADIKAQIVARRNKYFQDAQADMAKAQEELNTQVEMLNDRTSVLNHTKIYAPRDSVVNNIRFTTLGAVLKQGDVVFELMPLDAKLLAEAKVPPPDISNVQTGMPASIKLDAYDYSLYGNLEGNVSYVSSDIISEPVQGAMESFYRVHVEINRSSIKGNGIYDKIKLRPGLSGIVEIKAKSRSVLSYLTKPISKTLGESLGER